MRLVVPERLLVEEEARLREPEDRVVVLFLAPLRLDVVPLRLVEPERPDEDLDVAIDVKCSFLSKFQRGKLREWR